MKDKYLVGIDEYKILNKEASLGYIRDINSYIALLLHRKDSSVLINVEAYDKYIALDNLYEILSDKENPVLKAEIFIGPNTQKGSISILYFIFARLGIDYSLHKAFQSLSNEMSIGYDYNTKEYFVVTMDKSEPIFQKRLLR